MSSNKCARCEKTVYPIEELKCLDKKWHKGCFKCQECGMTLSMKSYKGFNKLPYCNAHIPQVKPTTTANSLESRRLAELTRLQSQVKYHENFEKSKGKVTQIADDVEMQRLKHTSKIISNVSYHGDVERKQQMEQKRNDIPNNDTQINKNSNDNYNYQDKHVNGDQYLNDAVYKKSFTDSRDKKIYEIYQEKAVKQNYDNDQYDNTLMPNTIKNNIYNLPQNQSNKMVWSPSVQQQRVFKAIFDYTARDVDEVSFLDGDLIVDCVHIDEGWMTGIIQRTGQYGMLPANYVKPYRLS